jgi:copper chaperone NosL
MEKLKRALIVFFSYFVLSGCVRSCSNSPDAIKYGHDTCEYCHMNISDPRYAAEFVTQKGRIYKFDSIGCLVEFYNKLKENPKIVFVADYISPHNFIDASTAQFFDSQDIAGPMGPTPVASASLVELQKISETTKGVMKDWKDIFMLNSK